MPGEQCGQRLLTLPKLLRVDAVTANIAVELFSAGVLNWDGKLKVYEHVPHFMVRDFAHASGKHTPWYLLLLVQ